MMVNLPDLTYYPGHRRLRDGTTEPHRFLPSRGNPGVNLCSICGEAVVPHGPMAGLLRSGTKRVRTEKYDH